MKMDMSRYFTLTIALLISAAGIQAQVTGAGELPVLFRSDEILALKLSADFRAVISVKDDSTYFPAKISWNDPDGIVREIDLRIRTRGNTRRQSSICPFPPLRLNFNRKETGGTPFEGQNVIKLVTHCDKAKAVEQNTVLEYLIYKAFNALTDSSLRVRPALISYVQTGGGRESTGKFAFFIEREKLLADRLNGVEVKSGKIHPTLMDPYQVCLVDLFQYMIGNTDYSIHGQHNIMVVSDSVRQRPAIPVPYDFDWSGLISAHYAVPHPAVNTQHVSERVYRGFRQDPAVVYQAIGRFNEKKQEIYRLFETYPRLHDRERKRVIKYLDEFYRIINNERLVKTEILDRARTEE